MNKYPKYKPSGSNWIGNIPVHWIVIPLKYIVDSNKRGLNENTEPNYELNYIEISDVDSSGNIINITPYLFKDSPSRCRRILSKGDVIVSTVRTYLKSIGYIDKEVENLICSTGFCVLTPKDKVLSKFLFFQILTEYFIGEVISKSVGVSYPSITSTELVNIKLLQPPLPEQHQIVQFLDEKTELVDKLISTKERKIDLLKQQRTSLINQVITKGLDPNVKMKDSGVEWIGEIPEHWEGIKIKYVGQINSGDTISSTLIESEGEFPVYGGNGIMGYFNDFNFSHSVLSIGRVGEKCGNVHLVNERCWINDNSLVLDKKNESINMDYLFHSLTTRDLNIIRNQNTQPLITGTMVKNETIPFPPIKEQQQIVEHLDTRTKEIDDLMSMEQRKIDLLKEYRQSLISEVITGKIDVRTNLN